MTLREPCAEIFDYTSQKLHRVFRFPNGYGVSVVKGPKTKNRQWELAIVQFYGSQFFEFYVDDTTKIANDLVAGLTDNEVDSIMEVVEHYRPYGEFPTA